MKTFLRFTGKVIKWLAISVVSILLICATANLLLTAYEKNSNPPIGKMIDVHGDKIHIYTKGSGSDTIVLMPGLGNASPVYDFMPLVNALEKDYTVCVVEPFGYGWSSQTNTPRTNEMIIEETRTALKQANISPPYILVPHSISGLYALHYANTYPEEVKAVVGLDTAYPAFAKNQENLGPPAIDIYGIAKNLGILRVMIALDPSILEYEGEEYTENDIKTIGMFACWNTGNKTVANEIAARFDNSSETLSMTFPESIPVRMILSTENIEGSKHETPPFDWVLEHEKLIAGNKNAKTEVLEGGHYIYYGNTQKVVDIINEIGK